jgi:hypothetical protein
MMVASQVADIRSFVLLAWTGEVVARAFLPAVSAFVPTSANHQTQAAANDRPTPAGMRARQPERPRHEYST